MGNLIHADIFFFITSIAVILLTILLILAFVYLIQILKNFRDISEIIKNGATKASMHIEDLSNSVVNNPIFRFIFGKKKTTKKRAKKE